MVHQFATLASGPWAKVDYAICRTHHLFVVFDYDDGIPLVPKPFECRDETFIVAGMEADGRLVEHVQHAGKPAADLRRQADALHFAAGKRRARTVKREIVESDVVEKLESLEYLLVDLLHLRRQFYASEMGKTVLYAHRHHFHDRLARNRHNPRFGS